MCEEKSKQYASISEKGETQKRERSAEELPLQRIPGGSHLISHRIFHAAVAATPW